MNTCEMIIKNYIQAIKLINSSNTESINDICGKIKEIETTYKQIPDIIIKELVEVKYKIEKCIFTDTDLYELILENFSKLQSNAYHYRGGDYYRNILNNLSSINDILECSLKNDISTLSIYIYNHDSDKSYNYEDYNIILRYIRDCVYFIPKHQSIISKNIQNILQEIDQLNLNYSISNNSYKLTKFEED